MRFLFSLMVLSLTVVGCSGGSGSDSGSGKASVLSGGSYGTLTSETTSLDSVSNHRWNEQNHAYEIETSSTESIVTITGTGQFRDVNSNTRQKDSLNASPEVVSQITVQEENGKFAMRQVMRINRLMGGAQVDVQLDSTVEMELAAGTVEDFAHGKKVTLKPTAAGLVQMKKDLESSSTSVMSQMFSQLLKGKDFTLEPTVVKTEVSENSRVEVSNTSLVYYTPSQSVRINVAAYRK